MTIFLTLTFMALIGALIGGFTNFIAIKMLFRPYKPMYLGKWRLPFTPGLIPKRRDELSTQLGRTIVDHLLTPETFKKRFLNEQMRTRTENWIQRQLALHLFQSDRSLNGWLQMANQEEMETKIEAKLDELVDLQTASIRGYIEGKTIRELLPENWRMEAEQKLVQGVQYSIDQATDYFASFEGRQTIKTFLEEFLASRGRFGSLLQSMLGESRPIIDRIQPEIVKFLHSSNTFELIASLAFGQWEKFQDKKADELFREFDFKPASDSVKQYVQETANIQGRLSATLAETWPRGLEWTSKHLTPLVTEFIFEQGEARLEEALRKINLESMVKEQVDSFELSRLEELVLGISRRELKMITVLGALLGGLIGVVQGFVAIALNL